MCNELICEILVLNEYASRECSGETVQMCSLTRAFTACTHKEGMQMMAQANF